MAEVYGSDGIPLDGRTSEYATALWLEGPSAFWLHPEGPLSDTTPDEWQAKRDAERKNADLAAAQNPWANAYMQAAQNPYLASQLQNAYAYQQLQGPFQPGQYIPLSGNLARMLGLA
jgi:hypothetical protein